MVAVSPLFVSSGSLTLNQNFASVSGWLYAWYATFQLMPFCSFDTVDANLSSVDFEV